MSYPILTKAPIIEALLDIQVELPESTHLDSLKDIYEIVKGEFPIEKKRYVHTSSINLNPDIQKGTVGDTSSIIDGYLFNSEDKKEVFQARLDGFTYNLSRKYDNWGVMLTNAKKYWEIYEQQAKPISIKRIALRFINKIPLKTPFIPSNYFRTIMYLGKGSEFGDLEYDINNLFSQFSINNPKINAMANITQAIEPESDNRVQFVFDIDVYMRGDFSPSEIWDYFESLREFKNEIFFKSITDRTLKILE